MDGIAEIEINKIIDEFDKKIDNYYEINDKMNNPILRDFFGTNINLKEFYNIYKKSDYYKNDTEEEQETNKKIIYSLIDIIILNIMINEIDMIDNIDINMDSTENEFDSLYSLSKSLNLINKTRILWERIMNFSYLLFERKDLDVKKSKKEKFRKWYKNNNFVFYEQLDNFITTFDEKYRTPETHKSSVLRKMFMNNELSPVKGISLRISLFFNNDIYKNILNVLFGKTIVNINWMKLKSINGADVPDKFNTIPDWLIDYFETEEDVKNIDGMITVPYDIKKGQFITKKTYESEIQNNNG